MKIFYIDKLIATHKVISNDRPFTYSKKRRFHHLAYHTKGESTQILNDKEVYIPTDTVMFLSQNESYLFHADMPTESISVEFTGNTDMESFAIDCSGNPKIKSLFQTLVSHKNLEDKNNMFLSLSAMYEIFNEIDKLQEKKYKSSTEKNKIKPAFDYIQEHCSDKILSNTALAKMCNLTERRFVTLFGEVYGVTPKQYIIHKKITKAEALLSSGLYTIGYISEMCGFSDIYYFSKAFKRYMNMSPTEYKNSIQLILG